MQYIRSEKLVKIEAKMMFIVIAFAVSIFMFSFLSSAFPADYEKPEFKLIMDVSDVPSTTRILYGEIIVTSIAASNLEALRQLGIATCRPDSDGILRIETIPYFEDGKSKHKWAQILQCVKLSKMDFGEFD